jgi:hypothetical protein
MFAGLLLRTYPVEQEKLVQVAAHCGEGSQTDPGRLRTKRETEGDAAVAPSQHSELDAPLMVAGSGFNLSVPVHAYASQVAVTQFSHVSGHWSFNFVTTDNPYDASTSSSHVSANEQSGSIAPPLQATLAEAFA